MDDWLLGVTGVDGSLSGFAGVDVAVACKDVVSLS